MREGKGGGGRRGVTQCNAGAVKLEMGAGQLHLSYFLKLFSLHDLTATDVSDEASLRTKKISRVHAFT